MEGSHEFLLSDLVRVSGRFSYRRFLVKGLVVVIIVVADGLDLECNVHLAMVGSDVSRLVFSLECRVESRG